MAKDNNKKLLNDSILRDIGNAVGSLEYGTVSIKVHDSKIIQIEVTERKRFDDLENGGWIGHLIFYYYQTGTGPTGPLQQLPKRFPRQLDNPTRFTGTSPPGRN